MSWGWLLICALPLLPAIVQMWGKSDPRDLHTIVKQMKENR